MKKKLEV